MTRRLDLGRAARTFSTLIRTRSAPSGAAFLRVTAGRSNARILERLRDTPSGMALLERRPKLTDQLKDLERLDGLEEGTLGRRYARFMASNGLDPCGVLEIYRMPPEGERESDEAYWARREVEMHDLRHVVTGYGADELGEICLLMFRHGQSGHPGMGFLAGFSAFWLACCGPRAKVFSAVAEALRAGRRARWIDDLAWEDLLTDPLARVRDRVGLFPPRAYKPFFLRRRGNTASVAANHAT